MSVPTLIQPDVKTVWSWLTAVPDPEIPAVSVIDLGIVRDVRWDEEDLIVDITPTYSGCPATSVIALDIELALLKKGIEHVRVKTVLSPAWTTDWISDTGRAKLKRYGIAPPLKGSTTCAGMIGLSVKPEVKVPCPRCGSVETKRVSQFGSTPCKASYSCISCLEPFDYFKPF